MSTSTRDVHRILSAMYDLRSEMVPCFIGPPGIGKTQGVFSFAREKGVQVVSFQLSTTVPSEVSGTAAPNWESGFMEWFDNQRMRSLKDGDILFFDEILEAPPALWSACLTLIQDRVMASGRKLPDVFIVAASNKVASPGIIPASTRDRFMFIDLKFDFNTWSNWFTETYGIDVDPKLEYRIQSDSTVYNILTPRRVTKLVSWLRTVPAEERKFCCDIIEDMFDSEVALILEGMVNQKMSMKAQIKNALADRGLLMPAGSEDMTLKEIFELLQAMPEWPEIEKALAETEEA